MGGGMISSTVDRFLCGLLALVISLSAAAMAQARGDMPARYAAVVIDHSSGDVLTGYDPNGLRHPASLTKMMTVYLAFEAIRAGKITLATRLPVSARAASRPPSRLGVRSGSAISVDDAIMALLTKSANDVASVVAEGLAGSEEAFASQMTAKARRLGMKKTRFTNASGLPDAKQVTTAREMARLAAHLIDDFPEYYPYFSRAEFAWAGRTIPNHNWLLGRYPGTDGLKTGFTNASGYNLVASSVRGGHRLIAVVLGGKTARTRDRQVMRLLDDGFVSVRVARALPLLDTPGGVAVAAALPIPSAVAASRPDVDQGDADAVVAAPSPKPTPPKTRRTLTIEGGRFAVQVGGFASRAAARRQVQAVADNIAADLRGEQVVLKSVKGRHKLFVARMVGYDQSEARHACSVIKRQGHDCLVIHS